MSADSSTQCYSVIVQGQDYSKTLADLKARYGAQIDTICMELQTSMCEVIREEFLDAKHKTGSKRPIVGVNYMEERGSVSFEMGENQSIEFRPYWIAIARDDSAKFKDIKRLMAPPYTDDVLSPKTFYTPGDAYYGAEQRREAADQAELEKLRKEGIARADADREATQLGIIRDLMAFIEASTSEVSGERNCSLWDSVNINSIVESSIDGPDGALTRAKAMLGKTTTA